MKISLPGIMLTSMILISTTVSFAQTDETRQTKPRLTHQMTAEEYARRHEIGRAFVQTNPPEGEITNIAEFERAIGSVIAWPYEFGIPMSVIRELAKDDILTILVPNASAETNVRNQLTQARVNITNCRFMHIPTDSYWARDFGPWYVTYGDNQIGIIDFPYNRPRPNDDEAPKIMANNLGIEWFGMPVVHTGGNYMTDGYGFAASTMIAYTENSVSPAEVDQRMQNYLGITDYSVLEDPNNTYIDHIDCWGKYLAPDKVLIRSVPQSHPQYDEIEETAAYFQNKNSIYGTPYRVYRVNTPQNQPYTNSYILNDKVFVPIMGSSYDEAALQAYRDALPGYKVFGFLGKSDTPWESTDALHCRVHEMADLGMLYIKHVPLSGIQPVNSSYTINAKITAYSGETILSDSVIVYYRVNPTPNTPFTAITMNLPTDNQYTASIPAPVPGSKVEYYLFAKDGSERRETHPLIGKVDPHVFYVGSQGEANAQVNPGSLDYVAMVDTQETHSFTINNTGSLDLTYEIIFSTDVNDTLAFNLANSPAPTSWDNNTLTESNWTTFPVDQQGQVSNVVLSYTWNTDDYYSEGSLWIESPSGTKYKAGTDQLDGTYKVICPVFSGESINGTWKVWIEDTFGDGGHQATNITVKIAKVPIANWLSSESTQGSLAQEQSTEIAVTANAQNMPVGEYSGKITVYTNDVENQVIVIPVTFRVTVNTGIDPVVEKEAVSVYPNPFTNEIKISLVTEKSEQVSMELYNTDGKLVQRSVVNATQGEQIINLTTANIPQGTYILKVSTSEMTKNFKLIKN